MRIQNRNCSKTWGGGIVALEIPDAQDATSRLSFAERVDKFHTSDPFLKEDASDRAHLHRTQVQVRSPIPEPLPDVPQPFQEG